MLELAKPDPALLKPKSLVIFNMNWKACDIHQRVSEASRSLNMLAKAMGAGQSITFDVSRLGAGELIHGKGKPINPDVLDFLRQQHHEIREELNKDAAYLAFHETAEMLHKLRGRGHTLAVVYNGASKDCEEELCRARLRDYFEDQVFGRDRNGDKGRFDATLYSKVIESNHAQPRQALIVEETPEGAAFGRQTKANVAAYISLNNCPDSEFQQRQMKMRKAGVTHFVTTTYEIAELPDRIATREEMYSKFFPGLQ